MRILIIHRELPFPADNGGRLRSSYVIRYLASHFQVSLLCFADGEIAQEFPERALLHDFRTVPVPPAAALWRRLASGVPSEVVDLKCAAMQRMIQEQVQRDSPDVILVSEPALTPYLEPYTRQLRVLDYLMVQTLALERLLAIAKGPKKWLWQLRWQRSVAYHRQIARKYDLCLVNSQEDLDDLRRHAPYWKRIDFFPNGLQLDDYPIGLATPERGLLIYPGSVTYLSNRDAVAWMVEEILPRVRESIPDAKLLVTGNVPTDGSAPMGPGVVYSGRVADIRPVIASAWACVVPLRSGAGGTRFKVLEAMAIGTPLISTKIGLEGVEWTDGVNVCVAESAESFANQTVKVLSDEAYRHRLSRSARLLMEERYSWDVLGQRLANLLQEMLRQKKQS